MSSTSIIMVAIVVAIVVVYVIMSNNRRRKRNELLSRIQNEAGNYKFNNSEFTIWADSVLGIDNAGEVLVYKKDNQSPTNVFPLESMTSCRVETQRNGENSIAIEKVMLVLLYGKSKREEVITLFNSSERININNELMIANRWKERLESLKK